MSKSLKIYHSLLEGMWLTSLLFHHRGIERQTENQRNRNCEGRERNSKKQISRQMDASHTVYAQETLCVVVSQKCLTFAWLYQMRGAKRRVRDTLTRWVLWVGCSAEASSCLTQGHWSLTVYTLHQPWNEWYDTYTLTDVYRGHSSVYMNHRHNKQDGSDTRFHKKLEE